MLALPDKGMQRSVQVHNVDLNVLCDWIEACIIFDEDALSKSDVVDILIEEQIYLEQSFAAEMVENAWAIISDRTNYLSQPLGMSVAGNRIIRIDDWRVFPAYGFCLALSCVELYSRLPPLWRSSSVEQGDLFEELTAESISQAFQGWTVKRIGWSANNNRISLKDELPSIISELSEVEGAEAKLHLTVAVKDLGLDLLAFYSYDDRQASLPVLLVQCASGSNWTSKRHTPDIELWRKIISFNSQPIRAFAIPFAFADSLQFRRDAAPVNGVFVERYRLLKAFRQNNTNVSAALCNRLIDWLNPRIAQLQRIT